MFEPLGGLHGGREILDRARVRQVAALRHIAHDEMFAHQPFGQPCFSFCKTQSRPKPPRNARTGNRMVFGSPLGDIMQQNREINDIAVNFARTQQLKSDGVFFRGLALLDFGQ